MNSIYLTENWLNFLEDTFRWKVQFLRLAERDVPVVVKRRINLTKCASTLPFAHFLPDLAVEETESLKEQLDNFGVRDFNYHGLIVNPKLKTYSLNSTVQIDFSKHLTPDALLTSFHKDSIQRKIRRAQHSGIKVEVLTSERDFASFQTLQSETRKRQGAPTYPSDFFVKLRTHLGTAGLANLFGVFDNRGQLVSGIITFNYQGNSIYAYGASSVEHELYKAGANQLTMWASIQHAIKLGATVYDFGSTPNHHKTLMEYKLKWASQRHDLYYSFYSLDNSEVPTINRQSKSMIRLEKLIQKMPDFMFRKITPHLLRLAVS